MYLKNPFKTLSRFEWLLWIFSNLIIIVSFLLGKEFDFLVLVASLIGATALIFVAKGNPFGQIMTVVFAVFYAVISYRFKYYGEMITYLGMTSPIAIAATVEWFKNPFEKGKSEVKIK
ncbi:MAG: nicotinamide riboside transporter PnuC, partial [Clostridia bacterium]|nr:nicotinamide riboside transporter PnuC [Clostridia bacterium]